MAYFDSAPSMADLRDGTSQTMLASETLMGSERDLTGPRPEDHRYQLGWPPNLRFGTGVPGFNGIANPDLAAPAATCANWQGSRAHAWLFGRSMQSTFSAYLPPNPRMPDIAGQMHMGFDSARSNHPGGVNTLYADGHVRFVKDSIQLGTWRALASRAGGEVISADAF
jgi:prepilin-type processing-associated H-X9-DG protein